MPAQEPSQDREADDERRPLLAHAQESSTEPEHGRTEQRESNADGTDETPVADEPSTPKLALILGSVWLGVFINALDMTIVATLSGPISSTFNSFTLFSWLATAYLIANAAFQPLSGKLTDIFGRRAGLVTSNAFFLVGNLMCGLAQEEWVIIAGRVIAGIGGGCVNTIATFVASDLVPLRQRGLIQGMGNISFGVGGALGGVLGGWISDVWSWRWAFLIQCPILALSAAVSFFTVKIPVKKTEQSRLSRVDFLGSFTLILSLVLLLLGLNSGGNLVPWNHPLVYVSLPLSGVVLGVFVWIEDRVASEPIIPVRLLTERTVAAGCISNWFGTMAYYAFLFYAPFYFQVLGSSAGGAGARLIPAALGTSIGSLGAGLIMRMTGRYFLLNALTTPLMIICSALMLGLFDEKLAAWPPYVIFFVNGLGYAGLITVTLLALLSAVAHEHQAVITSASYAFRATGSSIGVTISSAVFQNVLTGRLWEHLRGKADNVADVIAKLRDRPDLIRDLPSSLQQDAIKGYVESLRAVWATILVLSVIAVLTSLLMRENKLYTTLARDR